MNIKKKIIGLLTVMLMLAMTMPLTALADSEEDITVMTEEEARERLIANGVNLDKLELTRAGLDGGRIVVEADRANGRIAVTYYTIATMVANEIGVKNLNLQELHSSDGVKIVISNYKDYYCFKKTYIGGVYYNTPKSGCAYNVTGDIYAILTTTEYIKHSTDGSVHY